MYDYLYYDKPIDQRKISELISLVYGIVPLKNYSSYRFLNKKESYGYTVLKFASSTANSKEKQAQQMNYDNFIQIMAEMVQKYAGQIQL